LGGSNAPCYLVDNFTIIKPAIGAITSLGAFNIEPTKATVKYRLEKLKPNTTYQVQVTLNNGFVNLYSFISSSIGEHTAIIELGNNPYQLTGNTPYIANAKLILPSNLNEPAVSANPISFTTVSPILITVNNGITLAVTMPFGTDNPSQVAITNQQGDIVASLTYTGNPNLVFMTGNLTMGIYFISHTINGHTITQQFAIVR
jgi:hypothetical protein